MKGIIIVDIPVNDPVEIDEYGMIADLKIRPMTLTKREDLSFELKNIDIRPLPPEAKEYFEDRTFPYNNEYFVLGWNSYITTRTTSYLT